MLGIGVRPGVVEHELAVRIVLEVGGRRGDQSVALAQAGMLRRPAPARFQATVLLQTEQERVPDEGIAAVVQRIPLLRQATVRAIAIRRSDIGR